MALNVYDEHLYGHDQDNLGQDERNNNDLDDQQGLPVSDQLSNKQRGSLSGSSLQASVKGS